MLSNASKALTALVALAAFAACVSEGGQNTHMEMKTAIRPQGLAPFVGTWKTTGATRATADAPSELIDATDRYEWMEGGFFLLRHVDARTPYAVKALEIIGQDTVSGRHAAESSIAVTARTSDLSLERQPAGFAIHRRNLMKQDTSSSLTITRTFVAPRTRVFDAWTNPNSDVGWWGPKDFTLLFNEKDLKPGGRWRMGMTRKDKKDVSGGVYREIVAPERLVMTHGWEDAEGKLDASTLVTIALTERNGKTTMLFEQTGFEDADTRDGHRDGWTEAFDALVVALARQEESST